MTTWMQGARKTLCQATGHPNQFVLKPTWNLSSALKLVFSQQYSRKPHKAGFGTVLYYSNNRTGKKPQTMPNMEHFPLK